MKYIAKRKIKDKLMLSLIWGFAAITVGFLVWLLIYIVINGASHLNLKFITDIYNHNKGLYGIKPMIISTLWVVVVTILVATPIGIFSAIYLVEYSKQGKLLNTIRFATECLAGIPSIIYGLFGYIFFVTVLNLGYSILSGSLTLCIMVLPTIIRTTEEALKAVNPAYKEGSLALGATKLYTIFKVILPSAIPGIVTAVILSVGRVVGETAAVIFTVGNVYRIPKSILYSGRTLAVHLYILAKEAISFEQSYATACVLVIIVAILNFLANRLGKRLSKANMGE